jgi:predicted secreted hydrolase
MSRRSGVAALAAVFALTVSCRGPADSRTTVVEIAESSDPSGFARVFGPRPFRLPEDHGPHLEYQTEWWYYTGNLVGADGARYGYQLTFFRRGLSRGLDAHETGLATNQVYFAHLALTDVAADRHDASERFSRGAAGLAGARARPFEVWLEDWRVEGVSADGGTVRLRASDQGRGLELTLRALKPVVAHGENGVSAKSDEPGNASHYLSYTRMATEGRLSLGGRTVPVRGESWFDHEWSTSALGKGAVGWDWFSLQTSDGRELMLFQIRLAKGGVERASAGTIVDSSGRARRLTADDVRVEVLDRWRSAESGAEYPSRWRISAPAVGVDLRVLPWIADQELRSSFVYWEGAVRVEGTSGGLAVTGQGYVELTGYARSMQGVF